MAPTDPLEWARHPRSEAALHVLVRGAKSSRRLRAILEELQEIGVVSPDGGRLLAHWDGVRWAPHRHD